MGLPRPQDVDLPKSRWSAPVAHRVDLRRLALAVRAQAHVLPGRFSTDAVAGVPEIRSPGIVGNIRDRLPRLAVLDFPEGIAPELEIVSLVIDRIGTATVDQDSLIDAGNQIGKLNRRLRRLQPDVRHSLERNRGIGARVAAAHRLLLSDQVGLISNRLIAHADSVLHDRKLPRLHPVAVVAAPPTALPAAPPSVHVDDLLADL